MHMKLNADDSFECLPLDNLSQGLLANTDRAHMLNGDK